MSYSNLDDGVASTVENVVDFSNIEMESQYDEGLNLKKMSMQEIDDKMDEHHVREGMAEMGMGSIVVF